jgi:hypothetical protein
VIRGGYDKAYYPQKLQDWVGSQSGSVPVGASFQNTVSNTALSPDGLPNYGLRSIPQYVGRREHTRFHHQHHRHTAAGSRASTSDCSILRTQKLTFTTGTYRSRRRS